MSAASPPVSADRWSPKRLGVRLRSALAAIMVVAVVLAVAAAAFVLLHRRSLTAIAETAASARADAVADRVAAQDQVGLDRLLLTRAGELTVVQVVRPDGTVVDSSSNVLGEKALSPLRPAPGQELHETRQLPIAEEDPFRVVALGVTAPRGELIVLVGQSLRPVNESTETEVALLALGYPLLLLCVGAATALFVGRSLRAVEAVRQRVALISGRHLDERVPVPAAKDEIWQLARTMNAMLDRLEASAAAQRRFVADASHELRSPLSTLQVGLELLAAKQSRVPAAAVAVPVHAPATAKLAVPAGPAASTDGASLEALQEETARLHRLVDDLLLLARVDERGLARRDEDVDLDDLVDAERRRLANHADLRVDIVLQPVQVRGDRHQLGRALRNLVDNATRFASSRVELCVWRDDTGAHIEVSDDGPGIPPAERDRIFGRFVRLDGSRPRLTGGSGLGLAIVREIVNGHGGRVSVEEALGGGSRFRVDLPRTSAQAPATSR